MNPKEKQVNAKPVQQSGKKILDKIKKEISETPKAVWSDFSQHNKG